MALTEPSVPDFHLSSGQAPHLCIQSPASVTHQAWKTCQHGELMTIESCPHHSSDGFFIRSNKYEDFTRSIKPLCSPQQPVHLLVLPSSGVRNSFLRHSRKTEVLPGCAFFKIIIEVLVYVYVLVACVWVHFQNSQRRSSSDISFHSGLCALKYAVPRILFTCELFPEGCWNCSVDNKCNKLFHLSFFGVHVYWRSHHWFITYLCRKQDTRPQTKHECIPKLGVILL